MASAARILTSGSGSFNSIVIATKTVKINHITELERHSTERIPPRAAVTIVIVTTERFQIGVVGR